MDAKISAYGLTLTPEEWTKQAICRVGVGELKRRISMKEPPEEAITRPAERGPRKSRFIGVSWHVGNQKWIAQIRPYKSKKVVALGSFDDDVEAAKAYDKEAKKLGKNYNFND